MSFNPLFIGSRFVTREQLRAAGGSRERFNPLFIGSRFVTCTELPVELNLNRFNPLFIGSRFVTRWF